MTTTDKIMALAEEYSEKRHIHGAPRYSLISDDAKEKLRTEIETLVRDAERYRWLREKYQTEADDGQHGIEFAGDFEHYDDLDAAIDAAMENNND